MSIHQSLFVGGALAKDRSVWTRRERLERLMKEGRWSEESGSVCGLPKVRTKFKVISKKQKKAAAGTEGTAEKPAAKG